MKAHLANVRTDETACGLTVRRDSSQRVVGMRLTITTGDTTCPACLVAEAKRLEDTAKALRDRAQSLRVRLNVARIMGRQA